MKTVVPTIYGGVTMSALRHGTNINFSNDNSLLNKVVRQQAGIKDTLENVIPSVPIYENGETSLIKNRYFIIGSGMHVPSNDPTKPAYFNALPHRPTDSGPVLWLPFKLIPFGSQDITGTERQKYVMRRYIRINGINYIGYWIKRMPLSSSAVPGMFSYIVQNGVKQPSVAYEPSTTDMTPSRPVLSNGQLPNTGRYYEAKLPIELTFTADEVNDLREVAAIMFNDPNSAVISEIGYVYGIERGTAQSKNFTYFTDPTNPASSATNSDPNSIELAAAHVGCWHSLAKQVSQDADLVINLNIGATEPEFQVDE